MNRSTLQVGIVVFTIVTALVHLFLGISGLGDGAQALDILFILNGLGYFGLLAALLGWLPVLGNRPGLTHALYLGYAALTLVLYFVMNGFANIGIAAIVAKVAEVLLIIMLFLHMGAARTAQAGVSTS